MGCFFLIAEEDVSIMEISYRKGFQHKSRDRQIDQVNFQNNFIC